MGNRRNDVDPIDLHCAQQARDQQLEPVGTALSLAGLVLVERALPWPRDVSEDPVLGPAALAGSAVDARAIRPFAIVPPEGRDSAPGNDLTTVISYQRRGTLATPFSKTVYRVSSEQAGGLAETLAKGADPTHPTQADGLDRDDLLICTHGSRDRCCGNLGTTLHRAVSARWSHLDVHRASHTGGHRFAPTAILLPTGTCWGHLDDETLDAIITRRVPFVELLPYFRGSIAMPGPAAQVAEAAVAARVGWSLFDAPRQVFAVAEPTVDQTGRFEIATGDRNWTITVEHTGFTPQPLCMSPIAEATKSDPRFAVTTVDQH